MLLNKKRPLGRILVDGWFMSVQDLALLEQTRTSELLGQVLVRMGILDSAEVDGVLSIQDHLGDSETAVRLAAGGGRDGVRHRRIRSKNQKNL